MFRPEYDNEAAKEALTKSLSVSIDAYSVEIGGQIVAYVSSEKEAQDIPLKMKLEHVSKEDLDATNGSREQQE